MAMRMGASLWARLVIGVVIVLGCCVGAARAGFPPPEPPFLPPTGVSPEPQVFVPPPVEPPPPVQNAPEPATLVMGLIGAGLAGVAARRRRRQASTTNE